MTLTTTLMQQRGCKILAMFVAVFYLAGATNCFAQADSGNRILLQNMRLIVGDGTLLEDAALLVEQGRIIAVGYSGAITAPEGATVLDLEGKTVIPALIDAHAHLGYQSHDSWGGENYSRENLIDNLQQYAYYGFAAVFSAGSDPEQLAMELQRQHRNGEFYGARLLFAAGMAPPGQGPNNQFLEQALGVANRMEMTILHGLESPQQARDEVRQVAAQGIRFVKLWVDDRGGSQQKLQPEIYRAVIDEARTQGIKVFVHQQFAEDMPDLVAAGVHGFLHGRIGVELGDVISSQLGQAGAFVVPNLGLAELRRETLGQDPFLASILRPPALQRLSASSSQRTATPARDQALESELRASFASLLRSDVDIVLGTDAGALPDHPFGYSGHRELEIFARLGMTPMQAIVAATGNAARHLGLTEMGELKVGFGANLVVLDSNPLESIRNTRSIDRVMLDGNFIDRDRLRSRFNGSEN